MKAASIAKVVVAVVAWRLLDHIGYRAVEHAIDGAFPREVDVTPDADAIAQKYDGAENLRDRAAVGRSTSPPLTTFAAHVIANGHTHVASFLLTEEAEKWARAHDVRAKWAEDIWYSRLEVVIGNVGSDAADGFDA